MSYRQQINTIKQKIAVINKQLLIVTIEERQQLLMVKLDYDKELKRLYRLQWEEDNERVNIDDE